MPYEYTKDQECEYCVRFGYTSILTKDLKIVRLCVDHYKSSRLGLL
jgi:hypothetical protein